MKNKIKRIADALWKDDGISGALHYTEQISWILFLKFLDDYELREADNAVLNGVEYKYMLEPEYRWSSWIQLPSWDDLKDFVNDSLFPYLQDFREASSDYHSFYYKIGEIFSHIDNRIDSGHTLKDIVEIIDGLSFQKSDSLFELSQVYEELLYSMGSGGGNSGEFYTPRSIIRMMVDTLDPQVGQTVYDPSVGSCGFLIQAHEYMKAQVSSDAQLEKLSRETFYGNEKTPLAYTMWVMNMILHGISNPNISKKNTLTTDIRQIQEKDRYDLILANPPFGGKEKSIIQQNFPIKTTATEMLFLQHIMKHLRLGGRTAIVVPEGVLFNTSNALQEVKKMMLEDYNLHSIVSLPAGVFLPYSGVKTNVIFFDREGSTQDIWYYEIDLGRKITKNKPITHDEIKHIPSALKARELGNQSWIVSVDDIVDYDISAKNPYKGVEEVIRAPQEIFADLQESEKQIQVLLSELQDIIK